MARTARTHKPKHASSQAPSRQATRSHGMFDGPREVTAPRLVLIVCVFILTLLGLVMVFSTSSIAAISQEASPTADLLKQAGAALVGIGICVFMRVCIPYYKWLGPVLWVVYAGVVTLLLLTAFIGTTELGAQRWLSIGPISFQPSEFAKPAFILMGARIMYLSRVETFEPARTAMMMAIFVLAPLILLYATQSDLGTSIICIVGLLTALWLCDVPLRFMFIILLVLAALGLVATFGVGYRADRMAFLDPSADPYGAGYQLMRSFYAFGEGGLLGVGLGNSSEKYLYLPEADTDFIFAIIGEELGLVGAIAVIVLFIGILWSGLRIARSAPDLFGTMIAGSCTIMLVFQAFLNIACVVGLFPTTGKPLPFISSGGSALIGSFVLVGLVLSVSFASGDAPGIYRRRRDELRVVSSKSPRGSSSSGRSHSRGSRRSA